MERVDQFHDILEERRRESSNLVWVSRRLHPQLAYVRDARPSPELYKHQVLQSLRVQELIDAICRESTDGTRREDVVNHVKLILDEIGFAKQLKLIRWMGLCLVKICRTMYTSINVNENAVARVKRAMGGCPVVFAPSHRSYADFILMSYLCFTYDIEIPAIAAGMDFQGMRGMGEVLRNTGAFFMRRSYNDAEPLYWHTFTQYIHQIVTRGDIPLELFVEGTRSRSCKSLPPKSGLLAMVLRSLFTAETPDVLIVPISISYERILEERLFAYELLGVPKPKESTSGFFKALGIIRDNHGAVYINCGAPISARNYFGKNLRRETHITGPVHHQKLTTAERNQISGLARHVVDQQRNLAVLTQFNITSLLIYQQITTNRPAYTLDALTHEVQWLQGVFEALGANVARTSITDTLSVHKGLVAMDTDGRVRLVQCDSISRPGNFKGHALSTQTMQLAIPLVMLQEYVNPCLYWIVDSALLSLTMQTHSGDNVHENYLFLRKLFTLEFVLGDMTDVTPAPNQKLSELFCNLLCPFFSAYHCVVHTVLSMDCEVVSQSELLCKAQASLECALSNDSRVHPYSLSLESLGHCVQSLYALGALTKDASGVGYVRDKSRLREIGERLARYTTAHGGLGHATMHSKL